ncbi:methyltransferase domain-containing protein [Cellulophaga omnivescoria]|uniref:methyltransferase domain-containing protein n=1 Tax=Cellulophaga omnivescoria TaxID=1888890 RepID=UPI000984E785|nr:methyltransferase domain-containing protein [Cellulophaga omnivescoria]
MLLTKTNTLDSVSIYLNEYQLSFYYAESYFLYKNHLNYLISRLNKYKSYQENTERKKYFNLLNDAYSQNAKNVNKIVSTLKSNVSITAYENLKVNSTNNTQTTLKDFIYLRRDWCFLPEAEEQLKTTIDPIKQELSKIKFENNNSLFLGCGVGRIAFEFENVYKKIYATDKSFSMIWHLQKLLNGELINFYNPHEKNTHRLENVAQKYIAEIPKEKLNKVKNKFEAFVSDVLDLPFENKSVNAIFSIYFTDVIALKLWFQQINDKLSDNGLFIHFGPLDYFFSDEREMLTAEEFRQFFESKGYTTLVDKIVETPHLEDSNSISYKVYRNWFFIAQKNKKEDIEVNDDTVLSIKEPISYERKGVIKDGIKENEVNLKLPNGNFSGADSVIQILKLVDGKNTFKEILIKLKKNGFVINDSDEIKNLLIDFLKQEIVTAN